jgi:hypothetical protein
MTTNTLFNVDHPHDGFPEPRADGPLVGKRYAPAWAK